MTEIALTGEIVDLDIAEIEEDEEDSAQYQVIARTQRMSFGDQMIFTKYQILTDTIAEIDDENNDWDERERRRARMAANKDLLQGFDELTSFLDRVAKVMRNGKRVSAKTMPADFITDVMKAIAAQRGRGASKN
jgi:hypothetical protein